jgi:two-component system chemotaxis response regulator CheB
MDVNMPRLDGLTALTAIVEEGIAPVLVVSSLAREGSLTAYEALELGAFDCVEKPGGTISASLDSVREAILSRLRTAAKGTGRRLRRRERLLLPGKRGERAEEEASPPLLPGSDCWGVAIGISTGGPRTIYEVLPLLPADLNAAVFLVQHMPPSFTRMYAERLDQCSLLRVVEAEEGMPVVPGTVFVGQGGRHLKVRRRGEGLRISLELRPRHFFLPSVGVMMDSVLDAFGPRTLGVLMTGMGDDGADALARIRERGGFGIAESEETAVVFGMPAEAIARGGRIWCFGAPDRRGDPGSGGDSDGGSEGGGIIVRTLIVEDDYASRKLFRAILVPYGRVDVAVNGREAVESFQLALEEGSPYDLVCLDIMMPEMDGQQALKMIREIEEERGILGGAGAKVVMLTALGGQEQVRLAFREQCEGYLVKPVTRDRLLRTVRELGLIPGEEAGS